MKKILVELNQKCNLNCEYCFYRDYGRVDDELTLEKLIEKNIETYNKIYLTGGEPFLNKDIEKIIGYLNEKKKKIIIFTNGILLKNFKMEKLISILEKIDKLIITLDTKNKNYLLRNNSEEKVIEVIKRILLISNNKLEIKIGVNKYNLSSLEETLDFLLRIGVNKFSFNLLHNINSCSKDIEITSEKEFKILFKILKKNYNYFRKNIEDFSIYYKKDISKLLEKCKCGENFIFLNCKGEIFPCPANLNGEKNKNKCFSKECINLWEMF